jgi:hypothetical protein
MSNRERFESNDKLAKCARQHWIPDFRSMLQDLISAACFIGKLPGKLNSAKIAHWQAKHAASPY